MTDRAAYIAIDWGTTNRRIFALDSSGGIVETFRDDKGILALQPQDYPAEIEAIRARVGDLPILCAGMIGSNRGWVELPYVPAPCGIKGLARAAHHMDAERVTILPGVSWSDGSTVDVMRGEEVQFLGAAMVRDVPEASLLCQPGTHCKWARIEDGSISWFRTAMTGEMFSLLQKHSLLSSQMERQTSADADFLRGVSDSATGDMLHFLFSARADHVSGRGEIDNTSAYVSGLLIGADVRSAVSDAHGKAIRAVSILADAHLGALYQAAIQQFGGADAISVNVIDSHAAFVAGIHQAREAL